jgi:PrgI family protein
MTEPLRAKIPADVDAADKIAYGLTARQLVILAVAGLAGYGAFQTLARWLPPAAAAAAMVPLAGLAVAVVLGRRDGLPLDAWLLHGLRFRKVPRLQAPAGTGSNGRAASLVATTGPPPVPAPLRLPAEAVTTAGLLVLPGEVSAAVVGSGTVNLGLRTGAEQQALLSGFGRWLNSLSAPVQVVVSTQRVDLAAHAARLEAAAQVMPHPALAAAAEDQAGFLRELADTRDPLRRQVLVVVRGDARGRGGATRRGEDTARALSALGVDARVLGAHAVVAAMATAIDPYAPPVGAARAAPGQVITGPPTNQP